MKTARRHQLRKRRRDARARVRHERWALAASHNLVNSTKQINPKVLKKLKGNTGPPGVTGSRGFAGPAGSQGSQGGPGPQGAPGVAGAPGQSALAPLPSRASESGVFRADGENPEKRLSEAITFPIPLPAPVFADNVFYLADEARTKACGGPGQAAPGDLCIYSLASEHTPGRKSSDREKNPLFRPTPEVGRFGFAMFWTVKAKPEEPAFDGGSYTYTAP